MDPTTPDPAGTDRTGIDANSVLTAMGEARVMRDLRSDLVPPELVDHLLWAATRAGSPSNSQLWHFVVVTDPEQRRRLGEVIAGFERLLDALPAPADDREVRARAATRHLATQIAEVPVLVFVCGENGYPARDPDPKYLWATLGGAAQNLLVAARALGLGAALTRYHIVDPGAIRGILSLPDDIEIGWLIPVGWPARPFGPVRRRPLDEVVHRDRWSSR